jgi:putative nucleotidyltransferase with HDIG domain
VVARPESALPRAADPPRADWQVADLVHGLFAARDAATVLARLRAALAERVRHDELGVFTLDAELGLLLPVGGGLPRGLETGVAARAVRRGRPVLVPADPEPNLRLVGREPQLPTELGVPLVADGAVVGAVEIFLGDGLVDRELELAFRLCDAGALALANAREREALEQQARTDAVRAAASGLQRLGRLDQVAERVADAAAALAGLAGAGVYVLAENGLTKAGGLVCSDLDLPLAERTLRRDERVVERGDSIRAGLPLRSGGRTLGALLVAADGLREAELRLLELLADDAAVALENALLYEAALRDSERAVAAGVESLANALEASDGDTHEHARWIAELAREVARELGLDEAAVERVELGALLHDIGKIGIGESVLLKPGRLTAAERTLIERHPALGEQILAPIERLQEVRRIVRHCHERWDGAGYPDRLAGEAIPLEARIIFVCDAFHAMTSDRPYRRALRRSEAIRRLEAAAGTQFDPAVVEATLAVLAR